MGKLNLSKLKDKVAQLKGENKGGGKKASVFWSPQLPKGESEKTYYVHPLPWPDLEDYPFKEKWFYYELGNMKDADGNSLKDENGKFIRAPLTLKQYGEDDPVENLIRQLWNDNGKEEEEAKEDREAAKKLFAGQTVYLPVIVRGEEALGPRLWRFSSKNVYQRLVELFMKEDKVGALNDPDNEYWLTVKVEAVPNKSPPMNKKVGTVDIDVFDTMPLSEDKELTKTWLESIPDLDEALKFHKYTAEQLKDLLVMWSENVSEENLPDDEGTEHTEEKAASKPAPKKTAKKKSKASKEEAMNELDNFNDDDDD